MATESTSANKRLSRFITHVKHIIVGLCLAIILVVIVFSVWVLITQAKVRHQQNALQHFYNTASLPLAGPLGQVMRSEPMNLNLHNGLAERIIYRTQTGTGANTFSSGMVFIPNNSNAGLPRPVVAWAHGTVGMGNQCAPSRTPNPLSAIPWVDSMLAKGWVVTATDYAGLGTPGTENYLVGSDEAHDVLNSVRAVINIKTAEASNTFAIWGHSQGGNSALFSASEAASYAPELKLVGTVASAPAAELPALFQETSGSLDWVIGPEVLVSWPNVNSALSPTQITTTAGYNNYQRIANQCVTTAALGGVIRAKLNQQFFKGNPISNPSWKAMAEQQSAPILKPNQPVMIAESLQDQVVLPDTTALYIKDACAAGSNLTSLWLADVGHIQLSSTIAPQVIGWLSERFAGVPNVSSCNQPLPIKPASPVI